MNTVVERYVKSFDPNALITNNFTISAPPKVVRSNNSQLKAYLVNGTWDDYGTIGNVLCSNTPGQVCSIGGYKLIAIGETEISGTVTNTIAANCSVDLTIEWIYDGNECPPDYCKCECTNYPGYCCYDKNGNPL